MSAQSSDTLPSCSASVRGFRKQTVQWSHRLFLNITHRATRRKTIHMVCSPTKFVLIGHGLSLIHFAPFQRSSGYVVGSDKRRSGGVRLHWPCHSVFAKLGSAERPKVGCDRAAPKLVLVRLSAPGKAKPRNIPTPSSIQFLHRRGFVRIGGACETQRPA